MGYYWDVYEFCVGVGGTLLDGGSGYGDDGSIGTGGGFQRSCEDHPPELDH